MEGPLSIFQCLILSLIVPIISKNFYYNSIVLRIFLHYFEKQSVFPPFFNSYYRVWCKLWDL